MHELWPLGTKWIQPVHSRTNSCMIAGGTEPDVRSRFLNFDDEAPRHVAQLRANFANHLGETAWVNFINRLQERSPDFAELWARHEGASRARTSTSNAALSSAHPQS